MTYPGDLKSEACSRTKQRGAFALQLPRSKRQPRGLSTAPSSIRTSQELYKASAFLNLSLGNRPLKMIRQFDSSGLCSDCEVIFLQWLLHGPALPKERWNRQRRRRKQ